MGENLKFTYLKAIGIVLVVLSHSSGGSIISFLGNYWFPPSSFFMPLFIFAAGYFYDETLSFGKYALKRFRRLVVPYYGWNLFYGLLITVLVFAGVSNVGNPITPYNFFITPWTTSNSGYAFNGVTWFALWLFTVQVGYTAIRKVLRLRNEYSLLICCFALGLIGTYFSTLGFYSEPLVAQLIKLLFGLPFLQLGYVYRVKLEAHDKPSVKSLVLVFLIQGALIGIFKSEFPFGFVVAGGGFDSVFLPFLTSLTGIWFWLQISTFLASKIGSIRTLRYLGNHTWDIMVHHVFGFWLLNTFFFAIAAPGFNVAEYRTKILYQYIINGDTHFLIFYAVAGIVVPLAIFKITSTFRGKLREMSVVRNGFHGLLRKQSKKL